MTTSTTSSPDLADSLALVEIKPGVSFSKAVLRSLLPDVETALFFGKVYKLTAAQIGVVLSVVLNTTLARALFGEAGLHSSELQDYLVGYYDEDEGWFVPGLVPKAEQGEITFAPDVPHGEILPHVWDSLRVEVADSIAKVAEKLESVVDALPGKQGQMVFKSLSVMNAKRPVLGDYKARIHHAPQKQNLLVLDVSGSMTAATVQTIVDDVVALAYKANAHLAIVSNTCSYWEPGQFGSAEVLKAAEFGGTHYETLASLFIDRDWGTVITVADYDSSWSAKEHLRTSCNAQIDELLDISLVNRPTFLAECVGQMAASVRPLLIANSSYVLQA